MEPTAPLAAELLDICLQLVVHRYITTGNYFGTQLTPFCLSEPQSPPMRDLSTKHQVPDMIYSSIAFYRVVPFGCVFAADRAIPSRGFHLYVVLLLQRSLNIIDVNRSEGELLGATSF
jgi:hypothetical protein